MAFAQLATIPGKFEPKKGQSYDQQTQPWRVARAGGPGRR